MARTIVIVNPGSSSKKFALFRSNRLILSAHYETVHDDEKETYVLHLNDKISSVDRETYNNALKNFIGKSEVPHGEIDAFALRVVAPGRFFMRHRIANKGYLFELNEAHNLSPLHITASIEAHKEILSLNTPHTPIAAISDSAFHHELSYVARNYAINRDLAEATDTYRYGYHGISLGSVVPQIEQHLADMPKRTIVCHLGSGSSVTALLEGRSVDTTMGFSPLEGLPMATRTGSIDIAAALHLKHTLQTDDKGLLAYLNTQAGLHGLSLGEKDMRALLAKRKTNINAAFAIEYFVHHVAQAVARMSVSLGGIDCLVFTGTIGERSDIIRHLVCKKLSFLGVDCATELNKQNSSAIRRIDSDTHTVKVIVVPAKEYEYMYDQTISLLGYSR